MNRKLTKLGVPLIISILMLLTYLTLFLGDEKIHSLTDEDGIFETLGALFFVMTSIFFGLTILYNYRRKKTLKLMLRQNIFYLLLGFVFFIGCMEEISWGQRILNLETPDNLAEYNVQNEINIHNLKWFHGSTESGESKDFWQKLINIDRLFSLFWLSFCLIIPLLAKYNSSIKNFLIKLNFPIVPIFLGSLFLGNYLVSKFIEYSVEGAGHSVTEIKETNIAFLFMFVALFGVYKMRQSKRAEIKTESHKSAYAKEDTFSL